MSNETQDAHQPGVAVPQPPFLIDRMPVTQELQSRAHQFGVPPQDGEKHSERGLALFPRRELLDASFSRMLQDYDAEYIRERWSAVAASADSEQSKRIQQEVLANGSYNGYRVGMGSLYQDANAETEDRVWMANLIHRAPETAEVIGTKGIAGFHATGSFALAGLIEDGVLLSGGRLEESGKASLTGEHDANPEGQASISFGTLAETGHNLASWGGPDRHLTSDEVRSELGGQIRDAEMLLGEHIGSRAATIYRRLMKNRQQALAEFDANPDSLTATMMRHRFPVAVGVTRDFVALAEGRRRKGNLYSGQRHYGEFRLDEGSISIDDLPVIAVPAEHVGPVQWLLQHFKHDHVVVVPTELLPEA